MKTISLKKVSAIAVASLGFGLLSVVPASAAAAELPSAGVATIAGSTNLGTTATANTWVSRTSFSSGTLGGTVTSADDKFFTAYLTDSAGTTAITLANGGLSAFSGVDDSAGPATLAGVVSAAGSGIFTLPATSSANDKYVSYTATYGNLAAGTYKLYFDANTTVGSGTLIATLVVVDAAAPKSVKWANGSVTEISSSAVDYDPTFTVLDANGATTVLVNNEKVQFDVTPQTGAAATQVEMGTNYAVIDAADAASSTYVYTTRLSGDGTTPTAGSTIAGTEYQIAATLQDGTTALAAPVSSKYKRLANTAALTGSLVFTSDAAGLVPITSITGTANVATAGFYVKALDANGGAIKTATVAFTVNTGAVTTAGINTDSSGLTSINTATPAAAGTLTVTATIATGAASITKTLSVVTATASAIAATDNGWSVTKNNGTGVVVTSTAPVTNAWDVALNVTSLTAKLSGVTANSAVKLTVGGTATTPKVNAVTGDIYPTADAAGAVSVTLSVGAGSTAGQTITLAADTGNFGGADTTLTITFRAVAAQIETAPLTTSLNMATPSTTKAITATVTDQFANPITGGSVTITNTVVPSGVTAATAVTVGTSAAGTATVSAVLGSVLGTYTFTVQAKDADGANAGTASSISYYVSTTGIAASLALTDDDTIVTTELTDDNKSTRAIVIAPANTTALGGGLTDNIVSITVTTATPAALGYSATATNGIRLFTSTPGAAALTAGKSSVVGVAGTTTLYAIPTKVGAGTITVTSGGLTQVFTLTGALAASVDKAAIVTLTSSTTIGQYTVKVTDIFGNGVVSDVSISLSGPGAFSNGFKNLTVSTGTDGTNTFNVVSDGSSATTITAVVPDANYNAITAAQVLAQGLPAGLGTSGATTNTATATMTGKGGSSELNSIMTSIASLNAKIVALNALIAKIMKRLNIR